MFFVRSTIARFTIFLLLLSFVPLAGGGCGKADAGSGGKSGGEGGGKPDENAPVSVDVVRAAPFRLRPETEYTGSTRATREVALRARVEGRILQLTVDVGDRVQRGQILARLDDELNQAGLRQANADLAGRESEAASARTLVSDARTRVAQAQLDVNQKTKDAERYEYLYREGAGAKIVAEQARTAARTAEQLLNSTREQVKSQQAALRAALARVASQRALVTQARARLGFAGLRAPVSGIITSRTAEAGNFVQTGAEILRIGDFRVLQVDVPISELDRRSVRVGQAARVRFDSIGEQEFLGRVDRISPQADAVARAVPVSITLSNSDGKLGAGLLARVRLGRRSETRLTIPDSAFTVGGRGKPGAGGGRSRGGGSERETGAPERAPSSLTSEIRDETVFVLVGEGEPLPPPPDGEKGKSGDGKSTDKPAESNRGGGASTGGGDAQPPERPKLSARIYTVESRRIKVGARADGQGEVVSGLRPGDRVVSRSAKPLKGEERVRPSILSEEALQPPEQSDAAATSLPADATTFPTGVRKGSGASSPGSAGAGPGAGSAAAGSGGAASGSAPAASGVGEGAARSASGVSGSAGAPSGSAPGVSGSAGAASGGGGTTSGGAAGTGS